MEIVVNQLPESSSECLFYKNGSCMLKGLEDCSLNSEDNKYCEFLTEVGKEIDEFYSEPHDNFLDLSKLEDQEGLGIDLSSSD